MAKTIKKQKVKQVEEVRDVTVINRAALAKALGIATKAVSANAPLPLLSNVLVECSNGNSSVAATDLEIGVRYGFPADGVAFKTCIPAKTFQSFVDAVSGETIEIKLNEADQSIVIVTDVSTSSIKCIMAEEFPEISRVTDPQVIISVAQFKHMVNRVAFAASNDDNRGTLVGVLLKVEHIQDEDGNDTDEQRFLMFAADGTRASYEETTAAIVQGENFQAVVKGSTLETIARLLPDDGMLEIEARENKILFHCEEVDVISQLLNGNFVDHHLVANSVLQRGTIITLSTLELLRACKQLKIFAQDTGATKMDIQDMMVRYSTMKHERGDSDIILFANKEGDNINVGLNVFLLYELLEVVKTPQVVISFNGDKKPILLKMEGVEEFYHIIMPVALM